MTDAPQAGRLEETPFAEVAGLLFQEKKTGILTLNSPKKERKVVFYEGNPVAVISSDPREHIARFLAAKDKVSKDEAEQLLQLPETKEALQGSEILTKEILTWGVKFRFVNLSYDFFRWEEGSFSFEEQPPPRDIFLMKVPASSLLTKGTRHMPPSLLMERVPGGYQIAPGTISREGVGPLGDEEAAFLRDCREGRLVREVLEDNSVEINRGRELLYAFNALGLISLEPVPEPEDLPLGLDLDKDDSIAPVGLEVDDTDVSESEPAMELEVPPAEAAEDVSVEPSPEADTRRDEPEPEAFGEAPVAEETPSLELEGPAGDDEPAPVAPPMELELEPTSAAAADVAPPEEEAPGLEIERHSYGEEAPPPERPAPIGLDFDTPAGEESPPGELAPPEPDEGDAPSLEPPPLEMPSADEALPPLDGGEPPPLDDSPGFPPAPWQDQDSSDTGADDSGGGASPFSPPETEDKPKPSHRGKPPSGEEKAKKPSGPLARVLTIIALLGAVGVVGSGLWMGWKTLQSPSTPLEPIPPAEEVGETTMAEGLPIPALPTSVKKAVKDAPQEKAARPAAGKQPAPAEAPPAKPAPKPLTAPPPLASGEGDFYSAGYNAYLAGDLDGAARAWKSALSAGALSHTIQVEVACVGDTVKNDMARFGKSYQVFAIPLSLKGRSCYRVLLGAFGSEAEAARTFDSLSPSLQKGLEIRTLKGMF